MKNIKFISRIIAALGLSFVIMFAHAGRPLWTFSPLTATTITVTDNETATVRYQITNQSRVTKTLVMQAIPGVTQITTSGNCPTPFVLGYQQSCTLNLSINGSALNRNVLGGPIVCQQGSLNQCYQPTSANSLNITKTTGMTYMVGGSVYGLLGTLVLENNGADPLTLTADGAFNFSQSLSSGSDYVVSVESQPANQFCTVTNGVGLITNTDISNITVNCSTNPRTVGGFLTGLASGQTVVLQNNGSDNLSLSDNGAFTFSESVAQGAPYNVTVLTQPSTQYCTVTNASGTAGSSDITNVGVTCSTNAYTVGGTVTGLSGALTLQNNGTDTLNINSDGSFTFSNPVAQGAPYDVTVTVQPNGQTCNISNASGNMGGASVTNVAVNCANNTTTLTTSLSNLALSVTGLTEYGISGTPQSGLSRLITITNTGLHTATELSISPTGLPSGTNLTTGCGSSLAASQSCNITVEPGATASSDGTNPCSNGTAPINGSITVTSSNANSVSTNVVILDYGCIYKAGYIYAFDDTTANTSSVGGKVVSTTDEAPPFPNGIIWSSNGATGVSARAATSYDRIPGIDETSTSTTGSPTYGSFDSFFVSTYANPNPFSAGSFALCNGKTDGACNTDNISIFYNQFITNNTLANSGNPLFTANPGPTNLANYAAGLCIQLQSQTTDWYLPALCELGYGTTYGCGDVNTPIMQNIQKSLIDMRNLNSAPSGSYWSSNEFRQAPSSTAFFQGFATSGNSTQGAIVKEALLGVRCSRTF